MRFVPLFLSLLVAASLGGTSLAAEHTRDSLATVSKAVAEAKAVLVDVRERPEWDAGHLRGARLLPLSALRSPVDPQVLARYLPASKIIYCHCAVGGRCLEAADILRRYGYEVRPLRAGYADLLKAGFPGAK